MGECIGLSTAKLESGEVIDVGFLHRKKLAGEPLPTCLCVACDRRLIARLGQIKVHHFGHAPDPTLSCWATRPEGEIHIEAKNKLARLLREWSAHPGGFHVLSRGPCRRCSVYRNGGMAKSPLIRFSGQYEVLTENWGDPSKRIRPDVQVVDHAGNPVLFVEVRVSHANTAEKIALVRQLGVPMIEVSGNAIVEWDGLNGIPILDVENAAKPTLCEECTTLTRQETERQLLESNVRAHVESFRQRALTVASKAIPLESREQTVAFCPVEFVAGDLRIGQTRLGVNFWTKGGDCVLALFHCQFFKNMTSTHKYPERLNWKLISTSSAAHFQASLDGLKAIARQWTREQMKAHAADAVLTYGGFAPKSTPRAASYTRRMDRLGRWQTYHKLSHLELDFGEDSELMKLAELVQEKDALKGWVNAKYVDEWVRSTYGFRSPPKASRSENNERRVQAYARRVMLEESCRSVRQSDRTEPQKKAWIAMIHNILGCYQSPGMISISDAVRTLVWGSH